MTTYVLGIEASEELNAVFAAIYLEIAKYPPFNGRPIMISPDMSMFTIGRSVFKKCDAVQFHYIGTALKIEAAHYYCLTGNEVELLT